MKTKQLFSKTILSAMFATAMAFGFSSAFAQVKIGSNPTTIDANNNLEVEASTAGRKTFINKTTGQVSIVDGTQGANKVLTSDANGNASWQSNFSLILMAKNDATLQPTGTTYIAPVPYVAGDGSTYDASTGVFTAPVDGFYNYNYSLEVSGIAGDIFTINILGLDLEDGDMRGSNGGTNYRAMGGTKFLFAGETFVPRLGRGGSVPFNTNWKVKRISIIVFKIEP
jgi:hypothetical protein